MKPSDQIPGQGRRPNQYEKGAAFLIIGVSAVIAIIIVMAFLAEFFPQFYENLNR